jgi:hypothetical protein
MPKRKRDEDTSSDTDNDSSSQSEESLATTESLNLEAYNQVKHDLPIEAAFLYRKDELDKLVSNNFDTIIAQQDEYLNNFKERMVNFLNSNDQMSAQHKLDEFILQEKDLCSNLPINGVIGNFVQQILNSTRLDKKPVSVEQISSTLNEILEKDTQDEDDSLDTRNISKATISAYEEYFNKKYDTLIEYGIVYSLPRGIHKWSYNANWMLSHFHKGTDVFIIKSAIDDAGKLRGETSDSKGDFGSGFFREIAICYSLGYKCEIREEDRQIILKHYNPSQLKTISLNEILQLSSSVQSLKQLELFYNTAMNDYQSLKYSVGFKTCTTEWPTASEDMQKEDEIQPTKESRVETIQEKPSESSGSSEPSHSVGNRPSMP